MSNTIVVLKGKSEISHELLKKEKENDEKVDIKEKINKP